MNAPDPFETIAEPSQRPADRLPSDGPGEDPEATLTDPDATRGPGLTTRLGETLPLDEAHLRSNHIQARVPGYEILAELGRGGMGVVYKARQLGLNRLVALKMILSGAHASDEDVTRFRTEAQAVASMQHPNIVQIYDIGDQDGMPFFSLEYVGGGHLAERLKGTPMPAREAARLVEIIALAVHQAHLRGIVHRDLKPANVLMTEDGVPKIADFGLAKRIDAEASGQTESGSILGSPSYMAPEQAEGLSKAVGPAADVYALGAILYDLLTGRPPFRAETAIKTMQQVINAEPAPPSRLQPGLDRDIETICLTCLQKNAPRRYATAEALADDLRRYQDGEPIHARPVGAMERSLRWCRRNPWLAALGAAVFLLLAVVAVGSSVAALRLEMARQKTIDAYNRALAEADRANLNAVRAELERNRADEKSKSLEEQLYFNNIALAEREWSANHVPRALHLLEACPARLRGWEWNYLDRLCHAELRTIPGPAGSAQSVALSPDGTLAATGATEGTIRIWNTSSGQQVHTLSGHSWTVASLAFSPDGATLLSASLDRTIRLWSVATGSEVRTIEGHETPIHAVAFSPDGTLIASAAGDDQRNLGELKLWDAATGRPRRALRGHQGVITALAFSPDGKQLASAGADASVRIWSIETGKPVHLLKGHAGPIRALAYSADGHHLFSAGEDRTIHVWDPATGQEVDTLDGHAGPVLALAHSSGGDRLASAGADGTVRVWEQSQHDWTSRIYRGHTAIVSSVAFDKQGLRLASADHSGALKLWDAETDPQAQNLVQLAQPPSGLAFHPHRHRLAIAGRDGKVQVFDMKSYEPFRTLDAHKMPVLDVAYSPDGKLLASASADGSIKLWDSKNGLLKQTLTGHKNDVRAITWSADGRCGIL